MSAAAIVFTVAFHSRIYKPKERLGSIELPGSSMCPNRLREVLSSLHSATLTVRRSLPTDERSRRHGRTESSPELSVHVSAKADYRTHLPRNLTIPDLGSRLDAIASDVESGRGSNSCAPPRWPIL